MSSFIAFRLRCFAQGLARLILTLLGLSGGFGRRLLHRELNERSAELAHVCRLATDTTDRDVALTAIALW
jgi:hypothetical protein